MIYFFIVKNCQKLIELHCGAFSQFLFRASLKPRIEHEGCVLVGAGEMLLALARCRRAVKEDEREKEECCDKASLPIFRNDQWEMFCGERDSANEKKIGRKTHYLAPA